jgi:hypothetical protein
VKIAVIQHVLCDTNEEDAVALGNAAADATDIGAEVVVLPPAPALSDLDNGDPVARLFEAIGESMSETVVYLNPSVAPDGVHTAELPLVGSTALIVGDACADRTAILEAAKKKPQIAILVPRAENELQAEAVLELALGLSNSFAGLVVVVDSAGAEPGEPGHGGSAIIALGEVMAEAMGQEDASLEWDVELPIPQPEPRALLPEVPPILTARAASHAGLKPDVDYPADLT